MKLMYKRMATEGNYLNRLALSAGLTWGGIVILSAMAGLMSVVETPAVAIICVCSAWFVLLIVGGLFLTFMESVGPRVNSSRTFVRLVCRYAVLGTYLPLIVLGVLLIFASRPMLGRSGAAGAEYIAAKLC